MTFHRLTPLGWACLGCGNPCALPHGADAGAVMSELVEPGPLDDVRIALCSELAPDRYMVTPGKAPLSLRIEVGRDADLSKVARVLHETLPVNWTTEGDVDVIHTSHDGNTLYRVNWLPDESDTTTESEDAVPLEVRVEDFLARGVTR